ncbi:2-deoxy-5-keto-D-gluconate 6-phosphate aldolase domain-containing protein [Undibacterium sp. TJN25]|uniref:2-deoxy-5-keto-D-gluconate 6-phosphate aldolase domain-containing protein n=1 Tax=Undibacterium sp. TJN25 TaxID=3413056 RepID=UPI003BF20644
MNPGYNKPLYLLPFDHRESYLSGMFHFETPLTQEQHDTVTDSKRVIYDGFREAVAAGVAASSAGILVDEEFGDQILRDAARSGYVTAVSVEKSGQQEFEFEYGDGFAAHLDAVKPTFAKVLVHYNPEGDAAMNQRQAARLRRVSDYCRQSGRRFMFELLVSATEEQLKYLHGNKDNYDSQLRPPLMRRAIRDLQDAGVEPDVWKIEGLDSREDCEMVVDTVQRDGRRQVSCIVLGRGADENKVVQWLKTAAAVPGFTGFAVGRTSFWDAVANYEAKKITREEAVSRIARRYREWVGIFEQAHEGNHEGNANKPNMDTAAKANT